MQRIVYDSFFLMCKLNYLSKKNPKEVKSLCKIEKI